MDIYENAINTIYSSVLDISDLDENQWSVYTLGYIAGICEFVKAYMNKEKDE